MVLQYLSREINVSPRRFKCVWPLHSNFKFLSMSDCSFSLFIVLFTFLLWTSGMELHSVFELARGTALTASIMWSCCWLCPFLSYV